MDVHKVIMNIFICYRESPLWEESLNIFKSIKKTLPTSVGISGGSHLGLSYQILLDVDIDKAVDLSNDISQKIISPILIVLSDVIVEMKDIPIGEWVDKDLIEPGIYFDKLVSENKTGIFKY